VKILLVNPSFYYQTPWLQISEPLGLLYLASYIREYSNHEVAILDCLDNMRIARVKKNSYWYGSNSEEILARIEEFKPDVIGITCLFSRKKEDFLACVSIIKENYPHVTLVGGGTYPSLFPEEVLQTGYFDYCIIGEGESTLLQLLNTLQDGSQTFENIEGLAYMDKGEMRITDKTSYIENLDSIPFPARDLINYETYLTRKSVLHGLGLNRAASILTSRSCPNRCNFCSMFRIHGPKWRSRSAANVVAEIRELIEHYAIDELFIMDDNFTFNRDRVMAICQEILNSGIKIRWNTPNGISINTLDKELLSTMKNSGCTSICIAIESGDEELRNKVIGKRLTNKKIEEITRAASELGIFVTAFYIIGMPGETTDKFQKSLDQIKTLPFNAIAAAFANPLPGTKLYQECLAKNWQMLDHDDNSNNVFYKPYIVTEDFSEEVLLQREKLLYRTFLRYRFFTLIKDAIFFRNYLLYPPFLLRIVKDRLFRK
jgi:anaerobic magnesium-protoporphyrin IX monomethyl ester cyclase